MQKPLTRVGRALYRSLISICINLDTTPALRLACFPPSRPFPGFLPSPPTVSGVFSALHMLQSCFRRPPSGFGEAECFLVLQGLNALLNEASFLCPTPQKAARGSAALFKASSAMLSLPEGDSRAKLLVDVTPGTLLLSHPSLTSPFERSVILVLQHGPVESVGVVLNGGRRIVENINMNPDGRNGVEIESCGSKDSGASCKKASGGVASPAAPKIVFSPLMSTPPLLFRQPALEGLPIPSGRSTPAQLHPSTNLSLLRHFSSPRAQFRLSAGEVAVGALCSVGLHTLPHVSGIWAVVGDEDEDGTLLAKFPLLPIGPGLDAPAPSWCWGAFRQWRREIMGLGGSSPSPGTTVGAGLKNSKERVKGGDGNEEADFDKLIRGVGVGGGAATHVFSAFHLQQRAEAEKNGISPFYGRIFSRLSIPQRRKRVAGGVSREGGRPRDGSGKSGGGGRWFGRSSLSITFSLGDNSSFPPPAQQRRGRSNTSYFDASPSSCTPPPPAAEAEAALPLWAGEGYTDEDLEYSGIVSADSAGKDSGGTGDSSASTASSEASTELEGRRFSFGLGRDSGHVGL